MTKAAARLLLQASGLLSAAKHGHGTHRALARSLPGVGMQTRGSDRTYTAAAACLLLLAPARYRLSAAL
ncbi:hypothetical protein, partial [Xanthomonas phaseoli]|uniref:hypothetical protein n=1 Tax=Xanthomonas phaseoli TaxID=1985254 RepID=UPI001EE67F7A